MCKEVFKRTSSGLIFGYSEVFGTNQECLFDDFFEYKKLIVPEIGYFPFVSSVKIWHGDVIDGIEFVYDKEYSSKGKSPFFHGGQNGWEARFELMPGDSIQVVEGEYGRYPFSLEPVQQEKDIIIRLRFITREGKEKRRHLQRLPPQFTRRIRGDDKRFRSACKIKKHSGGKAL